MKPPFKWDNYSDQPYQLKDKVYKKYMRKKEILSLLQTIFTALIVLPFSLVAMPFIKRKVIKNQYFFSMGVDFQRESDVSLELLDELGVSSILVRFKLWEMQELDQLKDFLLQNKKRKVILKIMQDRENIEDEKLFKENLYQIFVQLNTLVDIYEIGSTINRAKWGFFSVREYNKFYKIAYNLKKEKFPHLKLMGSGVIDFEFHFSAHTLFNFEQYKYDATSALLYVDRRGAPENTQIGFALADKIALLSTMVWLSPKTRHKVFITETNWPIKGTAPYAPTSEFECVDLQTYANYMVRYHLLALASQQINAISWHQLIASGYGLVDNRENMIKKYPAFEAYKVMLQHLQNAQFLRLDIKRDYYILQFLIEDTLLQIHWSLKPTTLKKEDDFKVFDIYGKIITDKELHIDNSPLYIYIK
jgi:hypothetical protein